MRHLKRGNKGIGAPSLLEPGLDRISPPARASTAAAATGSSARAGWTTRTRTSGRSSPRPWPASPARSAPPPPTDRTGVAVADALQLPESTIRYPDIRKLIEARRGHDEDVGVTCFCRIVEILRRHQKLLRQLVAVDFLAIETRIACLLVFC